ncbi:MAG TPA: outer membrane protein assembly factor BamB [Gammaproteobacteria bacterium]
MSATRALLALLLALQLAACGALGGGKDTGEPPAELTDFEPSLDVRRLWSTRVGKGTERLRLALRPATDGLRVYAGSHSGEVAALEAATGRRVWRVNTRAALSAGPAYAEGVLAFGTTDGELLLLDAETGEERWRQSVGSEVLAPPAIGPGVVVLRTVDGRLRGFSLDNGQTLWTVVQSPPALTLRGNTAPRVAGSVVVAGFENGRVGAYDLRTGDPLWEHTLAAPSGRSELERLVDIGAGIQIAGNDVFVAGYQGRAVGIDLMTGGVLWQQQMSSYAGLGVDVTNVYVTDDVGAVVALDRRNGSQLWRQEVLRLRDVTAPARFANAVVVGDFEGYLHWLDRDTGELVARAKAASDRITSAPLVLGESLFVQGDDGTVAAFALEEEEEEEEREDPEREA